MFLSAVARPFKSLAQRLLPRSRGPGHWRAGIFFRWLPRFKHMAHQRPDVPVHLFHACCSRHRIGARNSAIALGHPGMGKWPRPILRDASESAFVASERSAGAF
jgi:hypothetical protein